LFVLLAIVLGVVGLSELCGAVCEGGGGGVDAFVFEGGDNGGGAV